VQPSRTRSFLDRVGARGVEAGMSGMGKLLAIVRREYVERVRNRWFLIATIFGPVLFGVLMFAPAFLSDRVETASADLRYIIVIDATGGTVGRRIAAELVGGASGDPSRMRLHEVVPAAVAATEAAARSEVARRQAVGFLTLDSAALTGGEVRYAGTNATALGDLRRIESIVRQQVLAARLERAGVTPDESAELARAKVTLRTEHLTRARQGGASGEVSGTFALLVAVVLYSSILLYGQMVMRGVMEEKQTRVAEVVLSSVSANKLLAGKVIGVGAVGLSQLAIWAALSYGMMEVRRPVLARFGITATELRLPSVDLVTALSLLAFFLLGYVFFAALFAVVGAVVSSEQEAQQAQTPVILLLVSSVAVLQPVMTSPDGGLARVMATLPFSAPIVMPLRMSMVPVTNAEVLASLIALAAAVYWAVWLAARVYRVGLLMYGKQPSVREILRWTRRPA
jgi:ABC-2 type transport system permease protein